MATSDPTTGRSVFITGIEGFVGATLAEHLRRNKYSVAGVFLADPTTDLSFARVRRCDVRDEQRLKEVLAETAPDFIVHLAAVSWTKAAERDSSQTMEINVGGTINLLEAVRQLGRAARVLVVSSSEVYGIPRGEVVFNESSPVNPMSVYAQSKLQAEQEALSLVRRHHLDVVILRPFSHTGPGQSTNFVFPKIAAKLARSEKDGSAADILLGSDRVGRDYTDVRDICRAYELALTRAESGQIYNLTSERLLLIADGIRRLVSQSRARINFVSSAEFPDEETSIIRGSSAKFRAATGWQPEHDILSTLDAVLDYERRRISVAV